MFDAFVTLGVAALIAVIVLALVIVSLWRDVRKGLAWRRA